jgi:hypothetical protein
MIGTGRFYVGTHHPSWLADPRADFPLCVSRRWLAPVARLRPSTESWILDSGGFSELSMFGRWTITPRQYVEEVARFEREVGLLEWASPMDWMCEWEVIHGGGPKNYPGTHLSVQEHQRRTVENYLELVQLWPTVSNSSPPFIPVIQGWTLGDYVRCADMYADAGVRLADQRAVGVGSVCRRKNTTRIGLILGWFADDFPVHAYGVTINGLIDNGTGHRIASADSLAWSQDARYSPPLPGHRARHQHCNNCLDYARAWRDSLLERVAAGASPQGPASTS